MATAALDVGASDGTWGLDFWESFTEIPVIFVEPQSQYISRLRALASTCPGCVVEESAVASSNELKHFILQHSNSRIASEECDLINSIAVEAKTMATILSKSLHLKPNILKLDIQGGELGALIGAGSCLEQFEVIILEISLLQFGNVPIYSDIHDSLATDYQLCDLIPQYYSPLDGALWQIDAFFVRKSSALLASKSWA